MLFLISMEENDLLKNKSEKGEKSLIKPKREMNMVNVKMCEINC